jgi:ABC-type oligopeptide transport system substrate-binding subunit
MMSKRVIALLLCLLMCMTALLGCSERIKADSEVKGAYMSMFLTDEIYNFDPALAYMNEEAESIVSLLFARLFSLDANGKLKYELAEEYEINEDDKTKEYTMTITICDAWWSDKIQLTADDIVFAWKRILNSENSFACAPLLFDLKNARAVKAGNCSVDDLGVCALNDNTLQITFEKPIDYDQFLINLTSLALVPLREDYVTKSDDWAKKPGTMVTSGPFKLSKIKFVESEKTTYKDINGSNDSGVPYEDYRNEKEATYTMLVLERNACYLRDPQEKDLDLNKEVNPYRIIIYCTKSPEDLLAAFNGGVVNTIDIDGDPATDDVVDVCGDIFYLGSIPLALRTNSELMDKADITDALSTMSFYLNENVLIKNQSTREEVALFANADVRLALSLALDRNSIASTLVLADAATGLVPTGIFNKGNKGSFREEGGELISTSANKTAAQEALARATINDQPVNPSDYTFTIRVNANDEAHLALAEAAAAAWGEEGLGFNVKIEKRGTIINNDYYKPTASVPKDICDDLYMESLMAGDFDVTILDYCAYTSNAYSMLAPFAFNFSGMVDKDFNMIPHTTGYNSEKYNALIEAIYYLPYYNQITSADYKSFMIYESAEAFQAILDSVAATYEEYGIDTSEPEDAKVTLLHKAEELLMQEMPIIPVVFNKNATVSTSDIKGVKSDYYVSYKFAGANLKNYEDYLLDFENIFAQKNPK